MLFKIDMTRSGTIISKLKKHYQKYKSELHYKNIYELTIAVILSAQTTDKQVNQVTPMLFETYPTFKALAQAKLSNIAHLIKKTGFYHNKSKNILNLARIIDKNYHGSVPPTREALMSLPGIGRKSANVILSQGFNIPALAVDTHVGRIARRLGISNEDKPDKVEHDLCATIPRDAWSETHLLFIKHGRTLCKARKPICAPCPVKDFCRYPDKTA
jgi:endonuclease III